VNISRLRAAQSLERLGTELASHFAEGTNMTTIIRDRSPRKLPQQSRARVTVDAILTASALVFREQGYERATTARIADVAGVSVGSLYQYFPDKASLALTLIEQLRARFATRFAETATRVVDLSFEDKVRAFARLAVDALEDDAALTTALIAVPRVVGDVELLGVPSIVSDIVESVLHRHAHETDLMNLDVASFVVVSCAQSVIIGRRALHHDPRERERTVEEVVRLVSRYAAC
jgi:AcrR family transcriptional regulator